MAEKLHRVGNDVVVLDMRDRGPFTREYVAEEINVALGFIRREDTVAYQLEHREKGDGLAIPNLEKQAWIAEMRSISPAVFIGAKQPMTPEETRPLVRKTLKIRGRS